MILKFNMDISTRRQYSTMTAGKTPPPHPIGIKLEREATMLEFSVSKGPPRPQTSSPMSEPPSSPVPIFSPIPEHPPATQRKPSQTDTDELLEFIRHKQNAKGLTLEREPTISWTEKKKPLLPDIPRTPREPKHEGGTMFPEFNQRPTALSSSSALSRSLENIPGPNPKLLEQKRLQGLSDHHGKKRVTRLGSLPPIEVLDRPSAPTPMHRQSHSLDDDEEWDDSSPDDELQGHTV